MKLVRLTSQPASRNAGGKLYVADTNNHLIRTVDVSTGKVETLEIKRTSAAKTQGGCKETHFSRRPHKSRLPKLS